MQQLGINAACMFVRTVLDELTSVDDTGMEADDDALDIRKIVENSIVEAVVKTHTAAPPYLLDGVKAQAGDYEATLIEGVKGAVQITMKQDTLRVVSVKADDSPVVVCSLVPEDSAEGRKQLNPHVRGVYDDPRVVLAKVWEEDYRPILRYYSSKDDSLPGFTLEYIPYPVIEDSMILISHRMEHAVLNELAAMVLESFNENEKAGLYRSKSREHMNL